MSDSVQFTDADCVIMLLRAKSLTLPRMFGRSGSQSQHSGNTLKKPRRHHHAAIMRLLCLKWATVMAYWGT